MNFPCTAAVAVYSLLVISYSYNRHPLTNDCWVLGHFETMVLSSVESELIGKYFNTTITQVSIFKCLLKGDEIFFCLSYSRVKQRNSFTILYSDHFYGQILHFIYYNNKAAAVVKKTN